MEQLRQILQLMSNGVTIREMARRIGLSRNSVRKYLVRLGAATDVASNNGLAVAAYDNEALRRDTARMEQLLLHF